MKCGDEFHVLLLYNMDSHKSSFTMGSDIFASVRTCVYQRFVYFIIWVVYYVECQRHRSILHSPAMKVNMGVCNCELR